MNVTGNMDLKDREWIDVTQDDNEFHIEYRKFTPSHSRYCLIFTYY